MQLLEQSTKKKQIERKHSCGRAMVFNQAKRMDKVCTSCDPRRCDDCHCCCCCWGFHRASDCREARGLASSDPCPRSTLSTADNHRKQHAMIYFIPLISYLLRFVSESCSTYVERKERKRPRISWITSIYLLVRENQNLIRRQCAIRIEKSRFLFEQSMV